MFSRLFVALLLSFDGFLRRWRAMVRLPKIESLVDLAFKPLVVAVDALIVGHSIFLELRALTVTLASLELTNVLGAARKPE